MGWCSHRGGGQSSHIRARSRRAKTPGVWINLCCFMDTQVSQFKFNFVSCSWLFLPVICTIPQHTVASSGSMPLWNPWSFASRLPSPLRYLRHVATMWVAPSTRVYHQIPWIATKDSGKYNIHNITRIYKQASWNVRAEFDCELRSKEKGEQLRNHGSRAMKGLANATTKNSKTIEERWYLSSHDISLSPHTNLCRWAL
jgi:hypothetical protein